MVERFSWIYDEIGTQTATLKQTALSFLKQIPLLSSLSDDQLGWVFLCLMLIIAMAVIVPLIKWSIKIAVGAAVLAAILTLVTSFSFWSILPFTGLAMAIVLFSNKFQVE